MSQAKMDTLCDIEGIVDSDLSYIIADSVNPGICMNEDCDYTTEVEPDSSTGWCEECSSNTVKSITELLFEGFHPNDD